MDGWVVEVRVGAGIQKRGYRRGKRGKQRRGGGEWRGVEERRFGDWITCDQLGRRRPSLCCPAKQQGWPPSSGLPASGHGGPRAVGRLSTKPPARGPRPPCQASLAPPDVGKPTSAPDNPGLIRRSCEWDASEEIPCVLHSVDKCLEWPAWLSQGMRLPSVPAMPLFFICRRKSRDRNEQRRVQRKVISTLARVDMFNR